MIIFSKIIQILITFFDKLQITSIIVIKISSKTNCFYYRLYTTVHLRISRLFASHRCKFYAFCKLSDVINETTKHESSLLNIIFYLLQYFGSYYRPVCGMQPCRPTETLSLHCVYDVRETAQILPSSCCLHIHLSNILNPMLANRLEVCDYVLSIWRPQVNSQFFNILV